MGQSELKENIMTSKSSFLLDKPERRISRGYCRGIGPKGSLPIYIFGPVVQAKDERLSKQGKSWSEETVLVNKESSFGHNGSRGWAKDKCLLD